MHLGPKISDVELAFLLAWPNKMRISMHGSFDFATQVPANVLVYTRGATDVLLMWALHGMYRGCYVPLSRQLASLP